ncbi:MAG: hypothetical protein AAF696_30085, partial [Bacteroidota bacterium]
MRTYFLFSFISLLFSPILNQAQNCSTNLVQGQNIIQNGDFEWGNVGFTTDTAYTDFRFSPTDFSNPGWYHVGADPTFFNSAFLGSDHTTGSGQFLMVDGSCDPNKVVWQQEVQVLPNTWYFFSTWLISIFNIAPAELQFYIDGIPLGNTFLAPPNQNWQEFTETWFSGTNTGTVTISVVNLTTNGCTNGNDFGMDDISFIPGCDFAATSSPVPDLGPDQIVCTGDLPITLSSGIPGPHNGLSFNWSTGATTESIVINTPGTYSLCVSEPGACISSDIVEIMDGNSISPNVSIFPTSGCTPLEVNIDNNTIGNALTYEWYLDGNLISTDPNLATYRVLNNTGSPINQILRLVINSPCGRGDTSINLSINPGPFVDAGPDISLCTGGVNVNTGQGVGLLSWSSPVENISYWPPQGAWANPPSSPGSYPYILTAADASSGCIASDTLFISRANSLAVEIIPGDTALCNTSSLTLSTNYPNANQYQWQCPESENT